MRTVLPFVFSLILCTSGWASDLKVNLAAPTVLPGVSTAMRTPGFWVARHPSPDEPVLGEKAIAGLNRRMVEDGLTVDLAHSLKVIPGAKVRALLATAMESLKKSDLYGEDGQRLNREFIDGFEREADAVAERVDVRFGFILRPADLRLLPTAVHAYLEPGDVDFDEIQNSGLEIGTPVRVLAHSRDRQWLFVQDAISTGWVAADSVARAPFEILSEQAKVNRPVVITSARADLFLDKEMTEYLSAARMGTVFVYKSLSGSCWEVTVPAASPDGQVRFISAYISRKDAASGFLPYTPRVIYEQAFKLLDAPYGWGDMNGGQDCSRFIQMIFATVGLQLPRNSAEQGRVGQMTAGFKEKLTVDQRAAALMSGGMPGVTILRLQGHIMLYLGSYKDKPYVIHSSWAYREAMPDGVQRARLIGRVAVTSMDLGSGSVKGSLLERMVASKILK